MKTYRLRLTVQTSVHIGTGESYCDFEYTVKDGKFFMIDKSKFFRRLSIENKIDQFVRIAGNGSVSSIITIRKFINQNFHPDDALAVLEIDKNALGDFRRKLFSFTNIEKHKIGKIKKVLNQMRTGKTYKNPLTFEPVIPGSSIKGAIRTAIIDRLLSENRQILDKIMQFKNSSKGRKKTFIKEGNKLLTDKTLRNFKANIKPVTAKDIMRFLKVSDFHPVKAKLRIGKATAVHRKKGNTGISAYLEYIAKGSTFEGTVTIDEATAEKLFGREATFRKHFLDIKNIMKYLRLHYGNKTYYRGEKEYFNDFIEWKLRGKKHDMEAPLKVGFHSGSLAVTTGHNEITLIYDKKRREFKPPPPLTLWTINKTPMGWCYIEVIE